MIVISNSILAAVQSVWIPESARVQSFYYQYLPKNSKEWLKCDIFCKTIIDLLNKAVNIKGILTANFDYWQDASFRSICQNNELLFIVLRRENELTNKAINRTKKRYENVEIGVVDLMLVFSERCKGVMKSIISEKIFFKNIIVTGPPRLDNTLSLSSTNKSKKKNIVIFSYINGRYCDDERNFWEVLKLVYDFVNKNKLKLVIKCKSNADLISIKENVMEIFPDISSIEWELGKKTCEVIEDSVCAIGYNSTVLCELLTTQINIIIPFIYTSKDEMMDAILHDADQYPGSGVTKVYTLNELNIFLKNMLVNKLFKVNKLNRTMLRDKYLSWDPDNLSSKRVEETIIKYFINK